MGSGKVVVGVVLLRVDNTRGNGSGSGGRLGLADSAAFVGAVGVHPLAVFTSAFTSSGPSFAFTGSFPGVGATGFHGRAGVFVKKASIAARRHAVGNHPLVVDRALRFGGVVSDRSIIVSEIFGSPAFARVVLVGDAEVMTVSSWAFTRLKFVTALRAAGRSAVGDHPFRVGEAFASSGPSSAGSIFVNTSIGFGGRATGKGFSSSGIGSGFGSSCFGSSISGIFVGGSFGISGFLCGGSSGGGSGFLCGGSFSFLCGGSSGSFGFVFFAVDIFEANRQFKLAFLAVDVFNAGSALLFNRGRDEGAFG